MSDAADMIDAMREGGFRDSEDAYQWTMTPNDDIGGLKPAVAAQRGLYAAVAKAARLHGQRLRQPQYRTLEN